MKEEEDEEQEQQDDSSMLNVLYLLGFVGTPRADIAPPEHPGIVRPTERPQTGSTFKEEIFVAEITGGMKQECRAVWR